MRLSSLFLLKDALIIVCMKTVNLCTSAILTLRPGCPMYALSSGPVLRVCTADTMLLAELFCIHVLQGHLKAPATYWPYWPVWHHLHLLKALAQTSALSIDIFYTSLNTSRRDCKWRWGAYTLSAGDQVRVCL